MNKREHIKRLLDFGDNKDVSTGYVSVAGENNSEDINEEITEWLRAGINPHSLRSRRTRWFDGFAPCFECITDRFEVWYTEGDILYIKYNKSYNEHDNMLYRFYMDYDKLIKAMRGGFDNIRYIVFKLENTVCNPESLIIRDTDYSHGSVFKTSVLETFIKEKIRFDVSGKNGVPEKIEAELLNLVSQGKGEYEDSKNADEKYDLRFKR